MANPDKTPLERLSWLQRQAETVPCVFVRTAELEALEAEVVRLRQERDHARKVAEDGWAWVDEVLKALGAATVFDIKERGAVVERLREALQQILAVPWTEEVDMGGEYVKKDWRMGMPMRDEISQIAKAALVASPDKPPEHG